MSDEMEVNYWDAYKLVNEYGLLSIPDDSDGVLQVVDAIQAAHQRGKVEGMKAMINVVCRYCKEGRRLVRGNAYDYHRQTEEPNTPCHAPTIRRQLEKESE